MLQLQITNSCLIPTVSILSNNTETEQHVAKFTENNSFLPRYLYLYHLKYYSKTRIKGICTTIKLIVTLC